MFGYSDTVTVLMGTPVEDPYSGESTGTSWDTPRTATVNGVGIAPRSSEEPREDARTSVIVGLTLYLPFDTAITAADRVRVETGYYAGTTYEVEGEPGAWRSPYTGWEPGLEVAVKVVTG